MDSGNEVISMVDGRVTTNGVNGHSADEGTEMTTRSRSTKSVASSQDGTGSGSKEKGEHEASVSKDIPSVRLVEVKTNGFTHKKSTSVEEDEQTAAPGKKRNEDDGNVDSKASNVSNDKEALSGRTQFSRKISTSTKKGSERLPLCSYDYDNVTFNEELISPLSSKRKATLYIEEMDEEEEAGEPNTKRLALAVRTNLLQVLCYPFKAVRSIAGLNVRAETVDVQPQDAREVSKENSSKGAEASVNIKKGPNQSDSCRVM